MLPNDTLDQASSKLLTKQMDLNNYIIHRRHVTQIEAVNKLPTGKHIKTFCKAKPELQKQERLDEIERENLRLFWAIKGTMTRKVWSKTRADQRDTSNNGNNGHLKSTKKSPRMFNRPSWPTTEAKQEDITSGQQNWRDKKELRRMSKYKNDQEQQRIENENARLLDRFLATKPHVPNHEELSQRAVSMKKLSKLASKEPEQNYTCSDRGDLVRAFGKRSNSVMPYSGGLPTEAQSSKIDSNEQPLLTSRHEQQTANQSQMNFFKNGSKRNSLLLQTQQVQNQHHQSAAQNQMHTTQPFLPKVHGRNVRSNIQSEANTTTNNNQKMYSPKVQQSQTVLFPGDQHLDFNRIHPFTTKTSGQIASVNKLKDVDIAPPKYFNLPGELMQTSPSERTNNNFTREKRKSLLPELNNQSGLSNALMYEDQPEMPVNSGNTNTKQKKKSKRIRHAESTLSTTRFIPGTNDTKGTLNQTSGTFIVPSTQQTQVYDKPFMNIDVLQCDTGIRYTGTFESMKRNNRKTIYSAYVSPDGDTKLQLDLQRDSIAKNSMFIRVVNPDNLMDFKEFEITVKQATGLLLRCNHDFSQFVAELLVVKDGKIQLRNMVTKVFNPRGLRQNSKRKLSQDKDTKYVSGGDTSNSDEYHKQGGTNAILPSMPLNQASEFSLHHTGGAVQSKTQFSPKVEKEDQEMGMQPQLLIGAQQPHRFPTQSIDVGYKIIQDESEPDTSKPNSPNNLSHNRPRNPTKDNNNHLESHQPPKSTIINQLSPSYNTSSNMQGSLPQTRSGEASHESKQQLTEKTLQGENYKSHGNMTDGTSNPTENTRGGAEIPVAILIESRSQTTAGNNFELIEEKSLEESPAKFNDFLADKYDQAQKEDANAVALRKNQLCYQQLFGRNPCHQCKACQNKTQTDDSQQIVRSIIF